MSFTDHFKGAKGYSPMPYKSIGKSQYALNIDKEIS